MLQCATQFVSKENSQNTHEKEIRNAVEHNHHSQNNRTYTRFLTGICQK